MQVCKAIKIWMEYHKSHSRDNTLKAYHMVLSNFGQEFGEKNVEEITSDEVLSFLNRITEGTKQQTKRIRYAHLSALFNFIRNNIDKNIQNPCDTPMLKSCSGIQGLHAGTRSKRTPSMRSFLRQQRTGIGFFWSSWRGVE